MSRNLEAYATGLGADRDTAHEIAKGLSEMNFPVTEKQRLVKQKLVSIVCREFTKNPVGKRRFTSENLESELFPQAFENAFNERLRVDERIMLVKKYVAKEPHKNLDAGSIQNTSNKLRETGKKLHTATLEELRILRDLAGPDF